MTDESGVGGDGSAIAELVDAVDGLRVAGVENRMFFGASDICAGIFRNTVRPDLLRRWIQFGDFPAPVLPKKRGRRGVLRVTTWGLVEAWLMVLYTNQYEPVGDKLLDPERGVKIRKQAVGLLRRLHGGEPDVVGEIAKTVEEQIEEKICRSVAEYERRLRAEVRARTERSDSAVRAAIERKRRSGGGGD